MSQKPRFAWHQLTQPANDHQPARQEVYDRGKEIHAKLKAMIGEQWLNQPEKVDETEHGTGLLYRDLELPFDIVYHPDVVRQEIGLDGLVYTRVYEVKSTLDFFKHRLYCECELSGYAHFLGARSADFVLYWKPDPSSPDSLSVSVLPMWRIPWEQLKALALRAYSEMQTA